MYARGLGRDHDTRALANGRRIAVSDSRGGPGRTPARVRTTPVDVATVGDAEEALGGGALPAAGDRFDGFEVESTLGSGAMGVVLLARDMDLGRRVAIKLLVPRQGGNAQAQQRLLREAQSVAQLQHPNVVALHQVGIRNGRVYLVMEFVDGGTLRQWADAQPRTWQAVVAVYRQAGAGLAAAHKAGLIHRDFKPDNVLIGTDGRVRVSDFGLVGLPGSEETNPKIQAADIRLTQTGAVMGTPAYMAPEQFAGTDVGPAADQFAFCVSLYQGLFGRRPFAGNNAGAILLAIEARQMQSLPRGHGVPAIVRAAIERGLHPDPEARHASLAALIDLLVPEPARRARTRWILGGATLVGALGWWATTREPVEPATAATSPDAAASTCSPVRDLVEAWSPARRVALYDNIAGSDFADAQGTAARAVTAADDRAADLAKARHDVCVASMTAPQASRAAMRACVEEQVFKFDTLVGRLAAPVPRAMAMASAALLVEGAPLVTCEDAPRAARRVFFSPGIATRAQVQLHRRAVRAQLMVQAGLGEEASRQAAELLAELDEPGPQTIVADAKLIASRPSTAGLDPKLSERLVRDSVAASRRAGDAMRESLALVRLIEILTVDGRATTALALSDQADAAAEAAGADAGWRVHSALAFAYLSAKAPELADARASLAVDSLGALGAKRALASIAVHTARGASLSAQKRFAEAALQHEASLEASAPYGPLHPLRAEILRKLGTALDLSGETAAARERLGQAIAILEPFAVSHRAALARTFAVVAEVERRASEFDAAARALTRAAELFGDDPATEERAASAFIELGIVNFNRGRNELADAALARAARLSKRHPGSPLIDIARMEGMAGGVAIALGDLERGLQHHARALEDHERRYGPSSLAVARAHATLGDIAMYMSACDAARGSYRRALRIRADLGQERDGEEVVRIAAGQATCDAIDGNIEDARDGLRLLQKELDAGVAPWLGGRMAMLQAAMSLRGGRLADARAHAIHARALYSAQGAGFKMDVDHADRWLAAHPQ